jgi:hypothetical protein
MDAPIAFRLQDTDLQAFQVVGLDVSKLLEPKTRKTTPMPSIVVVRQAAVLPDMKAGLLNVSDVLAVYGGSGNQSIILIAPDAVSGRIGAQADQNGDQRFLENVRKNAPKLYGLASQTIASIRRMGVRGDLEEGTAGRWVNRPINTFTLKVQPRAKNIQFTLYGNPETYEHTGFLLQDQNSYSRGWVRTMHDIEVLAKLAKESHLRRVR